MEFTLVKEIEGIPEMNEGDTKEFVIEAKTDVQKTYNFAPMESFTRTKTETGI